MKRALMVALNGTNVNPFHRFGLTQNPFPQTGRAEEDALCLALQKLGGDPIPNVAYIRTTLLGFHPEFVGLCCALFEPGKVVEFGIVWEEK